MGENIYASTVVTLILTISSIIISVDCCSARIFWPTSNEGKCGAEQISKDREMEKIVSAAILNVFKTTIDSEVARLNFSCPEEQGIFADRIDCSAYYICDKSNYTVEKCDKNLGFDTNTSKCIARDKVELCQLLQHDPDFDCKKNGLFPHPLDCNKFVVCVNGVGYTSSCTTDYNFDSQKNLCIPSMNSTTCSTPKVHKNQSPQ